MKKLIVLCLSALLLVASAASFAGIRGELAIIIDNNGYNGELNEPGTHKLTYFVTNLENEVVSYGEPAGTLDGHKRAQLGIASFSKETLTAHVKVIDPDANGTVVWEGDVIANANDQTIKTVLYNHDETHYNIETTIKKANEHDVGPRSLLWLAISVKK